jgi:ubiquinone/menaquinone biosynthesis C-methylase UbiE
VKPLLRVVFRLLYHQFAFTYDLVAATVSLGRWKDWVLSVLPFIEGARVLEIGHGPGHLQRALLSRQLFTVGIDASPQMGRLARHNLKESFPSASVDYTKAKLTRGISQELPFPAESFDTLIATFPAEYIFDPRTLLEAQRVLAPGGRFVVLPGATLMGRGILDRAMAWLFRTTGQTPPNLAQLLHERSREPFARASFQVQVHEVNVRSSLVLIIVARKLPA